MTHADDSDVFAIPDFWKPSIWLQESPLPLRMKSDFFALDIQCMYACGQILVLCLLYVAQETAPEWASEPCQSTKEGFFMLPEGLTGNRPSSIETSDVLPEEDLLSRQTATEDDLWLAAQSEAPSRPEYKSWAAFQSGLGDGRAVTFISESGPEVFDAFLASKEFGRDREDPGQYQVVPSAAYCACLLSLALGRASALFSWDVKKRSFVSRLDHVKIQGYSGQVLRGTRDLCLQCGNIGRLLDAFVKGTYSSQTTPSRIALANAINTLLVTIQGELGSRGETVKSMVQLQALVRPVQSLLQYVKRLVSRLSRSNSDESLLSVLFDEAQAVEYGEEYLRNTVREILRDVSKPFTDFAAEWIGLTLESGIRVTKHGRGKAFVKVENRMWVDDMGFELEEPDYFLDEDHMPNFMPEEVAQSLFETGRNLRFLWDNHPQHPLSDPKVLAAVRPPSLEWQFDWDALERVEHKAAAFERALQEALKQASTSSSSTEDARRASPDADGTGYELQFFGTDEHQAERGILASMAQLDQPLRARREDGLSSKLRLHLFDKPSSSASANQDFSPPWSLLPLLSFGPIVAAQARVVSRECMKALFEEHSVREHIVLQRNFQLLGNGVFCSRLSHALFDPELDTAEREAGIVLTGGTMGLRLGGRENWPPGGSELRLVLMGVLSESYQDSAARRARRAEHDLPGDLSFAVRDLSPDEMDRCMDPDALEALDFLRLSYKPPPALTAIMTPVVLAKYDRVFRLLLRVLRTLYASHQLLVHASAEAASAAARGDDDDDDDGDDDRSDDAATARFRIEARHFVANVAAYFFDTGVAGPWRRFEAWLDVVQADLARPWAPSAPSPGPDRLRERHEQAVDEVMAALLLRKRYQPVLQLLEDIFRVVLRFSKASRHRALHGAGRRVPGASAELYAVFRKKVEVFVTVCRGMGEKVGPGGKDGQQPRGQTGGHAGAEESAIARLLLMLDLTGYYTRKPTR